MKKNKLTLWIFICMLAGIIMGYVVHEYYTVAGVFDKVKVVAYTDKMAIISDIFLRLIKMIIAPLVLSTLIAGIAKLGDVKVVGRIGAKTMVWFISATIVSLCLGFVLVNTFKPGEAMHLSLPDVATETGIKNASLNPKDFISHLVPKSIFEAMAGNEILQIIVFAIFFGIACAAMGTISHPIVHAMDVLGHIMLKITTYVMYFAPIAVFAAISSTVAQNGLQVLITFGTLISQFYLGLAILWGILFLAAYIIIGKRTPLLFSKIKDAVLLAFGTASSESAFPKLKEQLERWGCKSQIVSFVLPLGYSFNLDGSMMYMTFASIFIAQCYGIHLSVTQQISMLLILMVTSKGIAGVPRASLVVISGVLASFHIPEAGLLLLMGIDQLLDMGRSATNVVGNAVATAVVSKWEGQLAHPDEHHH
jgi:Na+/H+-dicarboxylate symporter